MKTNTLAIIAALGLLPITGLAQTPPAPPPPPNQPNQPIPPVPPRDKDKDRDRDKGPKVPVTFLGVETSSIPRVVSEQLNLPKGFGLVVDYVVPDGPAAAAGVQQNDILKMFNDQILMEPDQLAKLVRSYQEGTNVTLTILRKNAETKVTVKLGKREVRTRDNMFDKHRPGHDDFGMMNEHLNDMKRDMGDFKFEFGDMSDLGPSIRETVANARREAARATAQARADARRARDEARRSAREMRVFSRDKGAMKATTIDLGKATIMFTDEKGEMKIETVSGKKILTAKDPQGRLLFSGPVDTKEDLDKVPAEVRQRYDKLEQKDLQAIIPNQFVDREDADDQDNDNDNDNDSDNDNDNDNDNDGVDVSGATMQQVSFQPCQRTVRNLNIVFI
jgi:serine protease Do